MLTLLLLCFTSAPAKAAYIGAVGDDITITLSGNFATIAVDEAGAYTLFWAAGGDYNAVPLAPDFTVDTQQRVWLSGHTDLVDHAIRRCPDGTWLHSASANVTNPNDTAWTFAYDADLTLTNEVLLDDQNPDIKHNDMALWCGDKRLVGFMGKEGTQWIMELNPDGSEARRVQVQSTAQLQGGQFWQDPAPEDGGDGLIYTIGRTWSHDAELSTFDADLNPISTVDVPSLSPPDEYAYWPQGFIRVGDYFLIAHMGRNDDDGWSQDTGNVYLSVLSIADGTVVEQVAVTDYAPGDGAMRPWAARDGNDLLVTWDVNLAPHVARVSFDAYALGEPGEPDTGEPDTGEPDTSGGDSDTGDSERDSQGEDTSGDGADDSGSPPGDSGGAGGCGCAVGGAGNGSVGGGAALLLVAICRRARQGLARSAPRR